MVFVREGQHDRSLARSAWKSVPAMSKRQRVDSSKEPSRRVRYDRAQRIPEVFLVDMRAVVLFQFSFETSSFQSSNRYAHLHESDRTLRDGSFGWLSLALRARLRSHRPSGTRSRRRLGHNPKSLSAFVERSDLLILPKSRNVQTPEPG